MNELAESISLSPTRLVHLFKEEVGVPIRRLAMAPDAGRGGADRQGRYPDRCSAGGGLCRFLALQPRFRNMFGITPSSVFGRAANVRIVIA